MRKLALSLLCALGLNGLMAQNESEQVLVFRNTGEVNLFYTDRLDSIVLNHGETPGQVFYDRDTTMVIPLAEIDSVAFGSRNEMEFRQDVLELTEATDQPWIIRFDGEAIYYRANIPASILPKAGERLFCGIGETGELGRLFPYGLTAKVTSVTPDGDEMRVAIESVELDEIFSKFFYAGRMREAISNIPSIRNRAPFSGGMDAKMTIPIGGQGQFEVSGKVVADGDVVINPLRHYYHANLDIDASYGFKLAVTSEESTTYSYEELTPQLTLASFYKIVDLRAAVGAFADLAAKLSLKFEMARTYHRKLLWTRQDGENSFALRDANQEEPYEDTAKLDLTLDGKVFFGPMLRLDFAVVGDVVGAAAKLKLGTELEGNFGIGMLRQLRDYNPSLYHAAELNACAKLSLEGYLLHRSGWIWADVTETKFCEFSFMAGKHTLELFPNYTQTRGVQFTDNRETTVTTATKVDNEIAHEVETGFELVDTQGEIVDSVFVDTIAVGRVEEVVGFDAKFAKPRTTKAESELRVRPVFHYAGYTVSADYAQVQSDMQIQPMLFTGSNGAVTYVASYPFTGEATADSTNYRAGAYLPIAVRDTVFQKEPRVVTVLPFIDNAKQTTLVGTWTGKEDSTPIALTFEADDTGTLNDENFTYELNQPQAGQLLLLVGKDKRPQILLLLNIQETFMQYRRPGNDTIYMLVKQ